MKYGFVKIATATPKVIIANPRANAIEIIKLIKQANTSLVDFLVFPELCVTGYTCGELFLSDILKESVYKALDVIRKSTIG
ncbi:MAG: hypothetical protein LBJ98_04325, partial [Endomicrobium sp.]|nr:hypothetical protein [Endomicrobium sp.]